jgi:hypothetical protein
VCASLNSLITSCTRAPARKRAAIAARSGGFNNRYRPRRPRRFTIDSSDQLNTKTIVLRQPDESTPKRFRRMQITLPGWRADLGVT